MSWVGERAAPVQVRATQSPWHACGRKPVGEGMSAGDQVRANAGTCAGGLDTGAGGARLADSCQIIVRARQPVTSRARASIVRTPDHRSLGALPTAAGGITRLAYAHARRAGVDPAPLLARAELTERQVLDRGARIEVRHQIEFLNLVAGALADPLLGFHLASAPDLRELGLLYYVIASSDTFGGAWRAGARYTSIVNEAVSLGYREGEEIDLTFGYVGIARHVDRHQIEFCMTALIRVCRELTGRVLTPRRVGFIHHRHDDASELAAFFGCKVDFGAPADRASFEAAARDVPMVGADPYLNELLVARGEEALAGHELAHLRAPARRGGRDLLGRARGAAP
jgi:hypothetical protein